MADKWMPEVGQECEYTSTAKVHWDKCFYIGKDSKKRDVVEADFGYTSGRDFDFRPIQTDKYRDKTLRVLQSYLYESPHWINMAAALTLAENLYNAGCRILSDDERIVKPLTDEQIESMTKTFNHPIIDVSDRLRETIDAVQRELRVIN